MKNTNCYPAVGMAPMTTGCARGAPFVEIRKRLGVEQLQRINETFLGINSSPGDEPDDSDCSLPEGTMGTKEEDPPHHGMLILDATAAPQKMAYPTDAGLLNQAREKLEAIIDVLWHPQPGAIKPRTYRQQAHKHYLAFSRKRNPRKKTIRKVLRRQLSYVRRDLQIIDSLLDQHKGGAFPLSYRQQRQLWIIRELFRQQEYMYKTKTHRIADRIVSISQPHVRPIIRGKAKAKTEFGAKLSASIIDGKVILDRLSWEAYNESEDLIGAVERYKERYGFYPQSVNADKIYWNRKNRRYLKSLGIAMYGGSPLGRPKGSRTPEEKRQHKLESVKRNWIEGAFGLGKRRYVLGLVMAKTRKTSESWIAMVIFIMNVAGVCRDQLFALFAFCKRFGVNRLRSIFDDIASQLSNKLRSCWAVSLLFPQQNVDRIQIVAF